MGFAHTLTDRGEGGIMFAGVFNTLSLVEASMNAFIVDHFWKVFALAVLGTVAYFALRVTEPRDNQQKVSNSRPSYFSLTAGVFCTCLS